MNDKEIVNAIDEFFEFGACRHGDEFLEGLNIIDVPCVSMDNLFQVNFSVMFDKGGYMFSNLHVDGITSILCGDNDYSVEERRDLYLEMSELREEVVSQLSNVNEILHGRVYEIYE